jgi:hypothetical protein
MSAQALFRNHEAGKLPTLDHSSIAVLSRTIIETSIMYWYLTEEVNEEEWAFRLQVMKIHDAAARDEMEDVHALQILLQSIKTLTEKGLGRSE